MISIIMPTYNRAYIIGRAIESVLKQTYEDWELIIIDDASEDNTEEVINSFFCPKIRYYVNKLNKGANESRNIGVQNARGEFLAFLDSDNYWPENKLELQINVVKNNMFSRIFLYGKTEIVDGKSERIVPENILSAEELKRKELYENVVDMNTVLIRRDLLLEAGGFDKNMPRLQDWELILKLLYSFKINGIGIDACLSFNEIQEDSLGRDNLKLIRALNILYKRYMCKYLNKEEMVCSLARLLHYREGKTEHLIKETITEICFENKDYLFSAMECIQKKEKDYRVSYRMQNMLYEWHMNNLHSKEGTIFSKYFYKGSEWKTIAIYGLGKLGSLFYNEVKKLPVEIKYGIDREKKTFGKIPVKNLEDLCDQVDCIVITTIRDCAQIKENIEKNYSGKIVTLEDLVQSACENKSI